MPQPVIVNLRVGASADGSITVFGEAENAPTTNIIDAAYSLPVGALYNDPNNGTTGNNALFKFQGRTTAEGEEIIVGAYGEQFTTNVTVLTEYLASIMTNTLNCGIDTSDHANAEPFNESKYSGIAAYQTFNSLGDLTLATYAHHLFGHVQATAAISNDVAVVTYMNGNDPTDTTVQYTRPDNTTGTTGATKANIAYNLANTIINGLSPEAITTIVNNVIKQDASRARFEDNDLNNPNSWQHLVFKPDDVVFVQVTLDPPRLSFGSADQQYQNNVPNIEAITYNFRIAMTENGGLVDDSGSGGGGGGTQPDLGFNITHLNWISANNAFADNDNSLVLTNTTLRTSTVGPGFYSYNTPLNSNNWSVSIALPGGTSAGTGFMNMYETPSDFVFVVHKTGEFLNGSFGGSRTSNTADIIILTIKSHPANQTYDIELNVNNSILSLPYTGQIDFSYPVKFVLTYNATTSTVSVVSPGDYSPGQMRPNPWQIVHSINNGAAPASAPVLDISGAMKFVTSGAPVTMTIEVA